MELRSRGRQTYSSLILCACLALVLASSQALCEVPEAQKTTSLAQRCVSWRASRASSPWSPERYDPVPELLSLRGDEELKEANDTLEPSALSLTQITGGVHLQLSDLLDLTEGRDQRIYLLGRVSACLSPSQVERPHTTERRDPHLLTLKSTHPLDVWVDGRGVSIERATPLSWRAHISPSSRDILVRLSPLAGRPSLSLSASSWRVKHQLFDAQSPTQVSVPTESSDQLGVRWRVTVQPFGVRVLSFSGQVSSTERPPSLDPMRDERRVRRHLARVCEGVSVTQAGWVAQSPRGGQAPEWRYRVQWRCTLQGERALLVAERWRRPPRGERWTLDRGEASALITWVERGDTLGWRLTEGGHSRGFWRASLTYARQVRSSHLQARSALEGSLSAQNLAEQLARLSSDPPRHARDAPTPHAPQTITRRWGEVALPSALVSQLTPLESALWGHFSYEVTPVARRAQPVFSEAETPLSEALTQRSRLEGWCAQQGGGPPELIGWGWEPELPLPYLGLRCAERDLSLAPAERPSLGPLRPIPEGAWCLELSRLKPRVERCGAPRARAVELVIKWSKYGDTWRAQWRHTPAERDPPRWFGASFNGEEGGRRVAHELAPADLLWETIRPSISELRAVGHLAWWSLPPERSAEERSRLWRGSLSSSAQAVQGSLDTATLDPLSPTARIELLSERVEGSRQLRGPLLSGDYKRIIELPEGHPALPNLRRVKPGRVTRAYGSYRRPQLLKQSEAGGGGWRLEASLSIARGATSLSEQEQLSFADAVHREEQALWEALSRPSVDTDAEVRDVLEDWLP